MSSKPLVVFCDFDGTITERDMILAVCEKFCPPQWLPIKDAIVSQAITVRQGIADLFAMIPASQKEAIIDYALATVRWRAGFPEFLDFCARRGIEFNVCSGGVDFFIHPLLAPFRAKINAIHCIPANFSGSTIRLNFLPGCETCSLCKATVIDAYPQAISILIGDGITDLHGARRASLVYARRELKTYLDAEKIPYIPFETFHDVMTHLSSFLGSAAPLVGLNFPIPARHA